MSPFNDSVERPSVKKKPQSSNPVSNLVKLTTLGVMGFGLLISNSLLPVSPGQDPQRDTVSVFLAHETSENCAGTGCIQVIAGTNEKGDIFTLSGALSVGDPRTPICEISSTGSLQGSGCSISDGVSGIFSTANADTRYVNVGGDTMTGALTIGTGSVVGDFNPQFFLSMLGNRNILIDGRSNKRIIDTGVMRFQHTPAIVNTRSITFDVNANGMNNTHSVVVDFVASGTVAGMSHDPFQLNIDTGNATGGETNALNVVKAGAGTLDVNALGVGADVDVIDQSVGTFGNVGSCTSTAGGDITASCNSAGTDATLFASDNDTLVIGHSSQFGSIEVNLDTVSSKDLQLTFEYSTGVGTWSSFTPSDETAGFTQNGQINWNISDISWATGAGSEYLIRITRTRNGALTAPIEDTIQVTDITSFGWDKNADITVNAISASGEPRISKTVILPLCDGVTACSTGTGVLFSMRGMGLKGNYTLSGAYLDVYQAGTTGTMTVQLRNLTDSADVFSTQIQVDSGETSSETAATPYVIGAATFTSKDRFVPFVSAVHTTPAQGVSLILDLIPE